MKRSKYSKLEKSNLPKLVEDSPNQLESSPRAAARAPPMHFRFENPLVPGKYSTTRARIIFRPYGTQSNLLEVLFQDHQLEI